MSHRRRIPISECVIVLCVAIIVTLVLLPALFEAIARSADGQHPTSNIQQPTTSINLPCEVIEVVDGDTLTVRVTCDVRVRLRDCWAAETRSSDMQHKAAGIAAREHLQTAALHQRGVLCVPLDGAARLDHVFSFGRVLAEVWIGETTQRKSVSTIQVEAGHAFRTKPELLESLR